jgi:steroid delta-isomerase-like uncharacterized protein
MGAAENLAIHARWADAENRHDLSQHSEFLHDDIEVFSPGTEPVIGLDGYLTMMEGLFAGLEDFHAEIHDRFATDDRVVCRWTTRGRHVGVVSGLPASGKFLEFPGASIWEFSDGKARRGWTFPGVAVIMQQLGFA